MTPERSFRLTDELLETALSREPRSALADEVAGEVLVAIQQTPQHRRSIISWPWAPAIPGSGAPTSRQRIALATVIVLLAVLVGVAIGIVAIVGSHPLPAPFGLTRAGLIALDTDGDLFTINADGTGGRQLTSGPAWDVDPVWSPDGTKLAFWSYAGPEYAGPVRLIATDARGTAETVIGTYSPEAVLAVPDSAGGLDSRPRRIVWSPDSNRVAFSVLVGSVTQVFVARVDGSETRQIGDPALQGRDPTWSPDGRLLAFAGGRADDVRGIYVMGADGTAPSRISRARGGAWSFAEPVWSPDGSQIAYAALAAGALDDIWVVGADGQNERDVSADAEEDQWPSWSPDGRLIGYVHGHSDLGRPTENVLVIVRPDGTEPITMPFAVASSTPGWSPDGTRVIAYAYNASLGYPDRALVIDWEHGVSTDVASAHTPGAAGSWQRLAP